MSYQHMVNQHNVNVNTMTGINHSAIHKINITNYFYFSVNRVVVKGRGRSQMVHHIPLVVHGVSIIMDVNSPGVKHHVNSD